MKKQTDTFKRLRAVIKDINGDNRQIIKTMQDQIDYLNEIPWGRCFRNHSPPAWGLASVY